MLQLRANLAKGRGGAGAAASSPARAAPLRSPPPPVQAEPRPELPADPLQRAGLCPDVVNAIMLREPVSHVQSAISEAILTYGGRPGACSARAQPTATHSCAPLASTRRSPSNCPRSPGSR
jgi:hypothetical protein